MAKTSGLISAQSSSSLVLVTLTKSSPKNTPLTPSIRSNCLKQEHLNDFSPSLCNQNILVSFKITYNARGLALAEDTEVKSYVLSPSSIFCPGKNFRVNGFGVFSTWMNIERTKSIDGGKKESNITILEACRRQSASENVTENVSSNGYSSTEHLCGGGSALKHSIVSFNIQGKSSQSNSTSRTRDYPFTTKNFFIVRVCFTLPFNTENKVRYKIAQSSDIT